MEQNVPQQVGEVTSIIRAVTADSHKRLQLFLENRITEGMYMLIGLFGEKPMFISAIWFFIVIITRSIILTIVSGLTAARYRLHAYIAARPCFAVTKAVRSGGGIR
jgi:hypothetical protein